MLQAIILILSLFVVIFMAGQIDITGLEREARKYWRRELS